MAILYKHFRRNERYICKYRPLQSDAFIFCVAAKGQASLYYSIMGNISVMLRRKPYIPGPLDAKVYIWFYLAIYIVYKVIYIGKGIYRVKDRRPYQ